MDIKRIKERTTQRKAAGLIPVYKIDKQVTLTPKTYTPGIVPCGHRGSPTGDTKECLSCQGKVSLKIFYCNVHQECTIAKRVDGVKGCCKDCPDYSPPPVVDPSNPSG